MQNQQVNIYRDVDHILTILKILYYIVLYTQCCNSIIIILLILKYFSQNFEYLIKVLSLQTLLSQNRFYNNFRFVQNHLIKI